MSYDLQQWDTVWVNVHLATMAEGYEGYGEIRDAAIAVRNGRIAWLGKRSELPPYQSQTEYDGKGYWLTPGLIDCHTHIVYAGTRSEEFEARLNGISYEEIAQRGGGILSTVLATRNASEQALYDASLPRVMNLLSEGVTTLEIKSGYGLDLASERKMLRTARRLGKDLPVRIKTTFLGAHTVPPEYTHQADTYIDMLCQQMLPLLAEEGLIDAVDAFCEKIGFSTEQTERLFSKACSLGLPIKLHAEQLSDQSGAQLTARYGGLSADHLEYLSMEGIAAMKQANTVAVLLPGAFYFLRETKQPPIQALREAGVPLAIATDCNPGTSPMTSLLLAMNMACTLFRLTPLEALAGVTLNAARALGIEHALGSLAVGKLADFALWDIERPGDLCYTIGAKPCRQVVNEGKLRPAVLD
ncbi:MAG: imidazolonepropionase [Pseudomonadota bacterium]